MAFTFRPHPLNSKDSKMELIADGLGTISQHMSKDLGDINFLLVDVTHGASTECLTRWQEYFINLFDPAGQINEHDSANIRYLFIGSENTVDAVATETERFRSIKMDLAFYLRTLQSYGLAHYGKVGETDLDSLSQEKDPNTIGSLTSAIHGLSRIYAKPQKPQHGSDLLEEVRTDIIFLINAAREIPGFARFGSDDRSADGKVLYQELINEICLHFQIGRRSNSLAWSPREQIKQTTLDKKSTFLMALPGTSYELDEAFRTNLKQWADSFTITAAEGNGELVYSGNADRAQDLSAISYKIQRYEIIRDIGRALGVGALPKLRRLSANAHATHGNAPHIFIIDRDLFNLTDNKAEGHQGLNSQTAQVALGFLKKIFSQARHSIKSLCVISPDCVSEMLDLVRMPPRASKSEDKFSGHCASGEPCDFTLGQLLSSNLVIMDPELGDGSDATAKVFELIEVLNYSQETTSARPPLVVFSSKTSAGYVQQCLNIGAAAFVERHRIFHLLFDMGRAVSPYLDGVRQNTQRSSHFRLLDSAKPHVITGLKRASGPTFITGAAAGQDQSSSFDIREANWISRLPKADLHCHVGTAISFGAIELMSVNSVGYVITGKYKDQPAKLKALMTRLARVVVVSESICASASWNTRVARRSAMLALGAAAFTSQNRTEAPQNFGLGDQIIAALWDLNDRLEEHELASILVALISLSNSDYQGKVSVFIQQKNEHLQHDFEVDEFWKAQGMPASASHRLHLHWLRDMFGSHGDGSGEVGLGDMAAHAREKAKVHLQRISGRWDGAFTREHIRESFWLHPDVGEEEFWENARAQHLGRFERARDFVIQSLQEARDWLKTADGRSASRLAEDWLARHNVLTASPGGSGTSGPATGDESHPLEKYVCVPDLGGDSDQKLDLSLYLRGADLLGSTHLQYPDNIMIAMYSFCWDNALDNVIYSELRCETTGYTKAGMGATDATEMLRHSINLAALSLARRTANTRSPLPLVRANIILAAKRHKDKSEATQIISLLDSYLERRSAEPDVAYARLQYPRQFPKAWRPCDVVGFDLCGNESKDADWIQPLIQPLAKRSSPTTIHAGEAASASSIWKAVYSLNATRIGHGLRLAEDTALLSYCVRQGICMEMCPTSNYFTNGFKEPSSALEFESQTLRYQYPLLLYMQAGMEVAIGTDNRYLHPQGYRTLTAEYIRAARLVGGLTRWEVLQLVKAGFKNAFLDKNEVRALLREVELAVYKIVSSR